MKTLSIIAVGTELTEGTIADTHIRYITSQLGKMGVAARGCALVPDKADLLRKELEHRKPDADILIVTGGLGPTSDDITTSVVAEFLGRDLVFHENAWRSILKRFAGRTPPDSNRKQACIPEGFALLENHHGTAPGFWGAAEDTLIFCLPGPPGELEPMFQNQVLPVVTERAGKGGPEDQLQGAAYCVSESSLEEAMKEAGSGPGQESVTWGTRIDEGRILFTLRGGSAERRRRLFQEVRRRLGTRWVREGDGSPVELLQQHLRDRGSTISVAESCTGGLFGKLMTDIPGSSDVFLGGLVAYSYSAKSRLLGVSRKMLESDGAVSRGVVEAMAAGAMGGFQSDWAVGISGIAGPAGGTARKPVGTVWISVSGGGAGVVSELFHFGGGRRFIRHKAAMAALIMADEAIRRTKDGE